MATSETNSQPTSTNENNENVETQPISPSTEEDVENFLKSLDNIEPEVTQDPTLPTPELSMANSMLSSDREELEESVNLDSLPEFEIPPNYEEELNPRSADEQDVDILADHSLPHFESIDSAEAPNGRGLDAQEMSFEEDPPELAPSMQDTSHLDPLSPNAQSALEEITETSDTPEKVEESKAEESKVEEFKAEEFKVEEPKAEESKVKEPKVEKSKVEESKPEESNVKESKVEESKVEESKIEDEIELVNEEADTKSPEEESPFASETEKIEEKVPTPTKEKTASELEVSAPVEDSPIQIASNVDSLFEATQDFDSFFDQSYTAADPSASFFDSFAPQNVNDPFGQPSTNVEYDTNQNQSYDQDYNPNITSQETYDPNSNTEYFDQYDQYNQNYSGTDYDPNAPLDASAQNYDPNAYYDQSQQTSYDPNTYPNSTDPASGYDYNQYYSEQGYDPNSYYDQSTYEGYDPNAYYDPNNPQSYDPNAYYDPNSQQVYDPNVQQTYDPNTQQVYDPNVQQTYDSNAQQAYDPNAYYDQGAYEGYDPNASYDPNSYYAEGTQQVQDESNYYNQSEQVNYDTTNYPTQDLQLSNIADPYYPTEVNTTEYSQHTPFDNQPSQYADNPNLTPRTLSGDSRDYFNQDEATTKDQLVGNHDGETIVNESKDLSAPPKLPIGQTTDYPATLPVDQANGTPNVLSPGFDHNQYSTLSYQEYNTNAQDVQITNESNYTDGNDGSVAITSETSGYALESPFPSTNTAPPVPPIMNQYSGYDSLTSSQHATAYDANTREIQPTYGYNPALSSEIEYSSFIPNMEPDEIDIRAQRKPYPIVAFGFGGKLVTSFFRNVQRYSNDTVIEKATVGEVRVGDFKSHLPPPDSTFNGPLWTGQSKHHKKVEPQILELIQSYLTLYNQGGVSSTEEEEIRDSRNILLKLLTTMVETQGKLFGDDSAENKLRAIFEPPSTSPSSLAEVIDSPTKTPNDSCLPEICRLLQDGARSDASKLAADNGHWAHALIISSCAGKEIWQDTIRRFIQQELKTSRNIAQPDALGALYGLFAGLGKQAIKDMFPVSDTSTPPPWKEVLRMICANRTPGDLVAMVTLGDQLLARGNVCAAHVCYLLSSPTAVLGGVDTPSVRWILAGSTISPLHFKDWESLRLTEIIEFAQGLAGATPGLPHLQSYKINYAWHLLDYGEIDAAASYCEAVINIVKGYTKGSSHFHSALIKQVNFLSDRIAKCGHSKGAASEFGTAWLTGKLATPSFDSLMSAVDRRLNQLITGDDEYTSQGSKNTEIKELKPGPTVFNYGASSTGASTPYGSNSSYLPNHLAQNPIGLSSPFGHHSLGDQDSVPFINLDQQFTPQTSTPAQGSPSRPPPPTINTFGDDDDLGFGNTSLKKKPDGAPTHHSTASDSAVQAQKDDTASDHSRSKSGGGGSMFGSLLKVFTFGSTTSDTSSPNPVKANLGEESSFYYDEKEKRWVNKAAPPSEATPTPTPPPPKNSASSFGPPKSEFDMAPPMSRSTPVTTGNSPDTSGPPSGVSTPGGPPTTGRKGGRKTLKNRYVDVMNN